MKLDLEHLEKNTTPSIFIVNNYQIYFAINCLIIMINSNSQ